MSEVPKMESFMFYCGAEYSDILRGSSHDFCYLLQVFWTLTSIKVLSSLL